MARLVKTLLNSLFFSSLCSFLIVLLLSSCLLISCSKSRQNFSSERAVDKATVLIDKGDYSAAIAFLETYMNEFARSEQEASELRLVLASAYAGRAGVKIENYWDYLVGFDVLAKQKKDNLNSDLITESSLPKKLTKELINQIKQINLVYVEVKKIQDKAAKIPLITMEKLNDIEKARNILISNKNFSKQDQNQQTQLSSQQQQQSSSLYRSVLTAVTLKFYLTEANDKYLNKILNTNDDVCSFEFSGFKQAVEHIISLLDDGLNDLSLAYPTEESHYQELREKLKNQTEPYLNENNDVSIMESLCTLKTIN